MHILQGGGSDIFSMDPDPAQLEKKSGSDLKTEIKKKIYLYFRYVGIKVDLINYHLKLEFVHSGLYCVQDENI